MNRDISEVKINVTMKQNLAMASRLAVLVSQSVSICSIRISRLQMSQQIIESPPGASGFARSTAAKSRRGAARA
jgi:hypothetical protein